MRAGYVQVHAAVHPPGPCTRAYLPAAPSQTYSSTVVCSTVGSLKVIIRSLRLLLDGGPMHGHMLLYRPITRQTKKNT